jgi:hypothetical protein
MLSRIFSSPVAEHSKDQNEYNTLIIREKQMGRLGARSEARGFHSESHQQDSRWSKSGLITPKRTLDLEQNCTITQEQNDWIKKHRFHVKFNDKVKG